MYLLNSLSWKKPPRGYEPLISTADDPEKSKAYDEPIKVEPLRYGDIPNAIQTLIGSAENDPLSRYLFETDAPQSLGRLRRRKLIHWFELSLMIQTRTGFTVHHGDSLGVRGLPPKDYPRSISDRIVAAVHTAIVKALRALNTAEQRKRMSELRTKLDKAVEVTFGDTVSGWYELEALCTAPLKQGHGYASALVRNVTEPADAAGRVTWLVSSNIDVPYFYESFGFREVARFVLGEDNPTWDGAPVLLKLMTREPQSARKEVTSLL